ncbi:recombinase family protein [Rheinheimera soli]|uniref:recombinase family protein n=1 Tax=Rheinheimera soli TaxID=443616 RepID=UPI001E3A51B3|nr:recombinase family protein [Rheinheimera soli]
MIEILRQQHRQFVLTLVYSIVKDSWRTTSYKKMVALLNQKEIRTTRGNLWTEKRLFRFLQNAGYSGLWGLSKEEEKPKVKPACRLATPI